MIEKFCSDCKHFGNHDVLGRFKRICNRPQEDETDPVYGGIKTKQILHCEDERRYGECGIDGRYWEEMKHV